MRRASLVLAVTLLAALPACKLGPSPSTAATPGAAAAGKDYPAVGVIKGFQSDNKVVVLQHQDIQGLMQGMTMGFELKDPALAQGFKVGDAVDFTLTVTGDDYIVTAMKKR
jgi:Cu/Ag efflux protein CusF